MAIHSANIPFLSRVAIICNPQFAADAKLWEQVVRQRGLTVRVFVNAAKARDWLYGEHP